MRSNLVFLCTKNGQWIDRLLQREIQGTLLGFWTEAFSQGALFPSLVRQAAQRDRTNSKVRRMKLCDETIPCQS